MREILFRGKCTEIVNDWITGFYVRLYDDKGHESHRIYPGYAETDCGDYYPDWYEVDPETIGQWTGLVDKNGVKVFEGDIVTLRTQADLEYGFHKRRCDIKFDEYHRFVAVGMITHPLIDNEEWEVIGNIHDKAVEE